jgi:hypothetical protein
MGLDDLEEARVNKGRQPAWHADNLGVARRLCGEAKITEAKAEQVDDLVSDLHDILDRLRAEVAVQRPAPGG